MNIKFSKYHFGVGLRVIKTLTGFVWWPAFVWESCVGALLFLHQLSSQRFGLLGVASAHEPIRSDRGVSLRGRINAAAARDTVPLRMTSMVPTLLSDFLFRSYLTFPESSASFRICRHYFSALQMVWICQYGWYFTCIVENRFFP